MAKVSMDFGLTLKIPGKDFEMIKPNVSFTDIDTEGDVEAQVALCVAAVSKIEAAAEGALAQVVADLTGMAFEGGGWTAAFNTYKANRKKWEDSVLGEVMRLGGEIERLGGEAPKKKETKGE
jgi:hypothetical protein